MKPEFQELLVCSCGDASHQVIFTAYSFEDEQGEVTLQTHLKTLPFWERLGNAFKYLFGFKSRYGDFDCLILDKDSVPVLKKVINRLSKNVRYL